MEASPVREQDVNPAADRLNQSCLCLTLDRKALCAALEQEAGDPEFCRTHVAPRSNLFSNVPVFLPTSSIDAMQGIVTAIHAVSQLPAYQEQVLSWAPEIARIDHGPAGAFMGYDFHLADDGPKLIEVNTNAGGAFLNALLAKAQFACCREMEHPPSLRWGGSFNADVDSMLEEEWKLQNASRPLNRIAIVDDEPETQYLYPEFILARAMLANAGYDAAIAAPEQFSFADDTLMLDGKPVDLVYNRLVDFAFEQPEHEALRLAYESGAAAFTPNPRNHALLADKRNLVLLSDPEALERLGVPSSIREVLKGIPRTRMVSAENSDELWRQRKHLFFKPARGHGSKAVYRGDKVTRGVFEDIVQGEYVAQEFAPPGQRMMRIDGAEAARKIDVRLYSYAGRTMLAAARLYQGQATNFRTPGGGFAPVFAID
ncbi:hypothetical protein [Aestuariivirga sp.]|uniref:hypothetical protein n=1 Tax=Aestuariivirga sp. TaxID=2650926 RepID=UPI00359418E5